MIQLHTHTRHSIADALPTSLEYATLVGEGGALAMTDHDNMSGMIEHILDCQKKKVKPILGVELTVRDDDGTKYHITLLAKNNKGLTNLFKMMASSKTFEDIAKYSEGVICLSGDLMSPVAVKFLLEGKDSAIKQIERLSSIFADFYLEIIDFGLEEQRLYNEFLMSVEDMSCGIVYTSDAHFLTKEDCKNQMALLCDKKGKGLTRLQIGFKWLEEAYLKPVPITDAMRDIVAMVNVTVEFGKYALPVYKTPKKFNDNQEDYLKHLVWQGLKSRGFHKNKEYVERARMELQVIAAMGFCGYFLIVWDFCDFCHNNGIIVGPGRGSGAGSLVAYCLRITDIDPIPYDLLFERFLNPERISMPDFDIDFDNIGRPRAIEYVVKKYGIEQVCQIGTFQEIASRSAWKAAARVMGVSVKESEKFSKLLPDNVGSKTYLCDLFSPDGRPIKNQDLDRPEFYEVLKVAMGIEKTYKSVGKHAAGILILDRPVLDFMPAWPTQGVDTPFSKEKEGESKKKNQKIKNIKKKTQEEDLGVEMAYVSQISHKYAEKIGGIKFDFLGLKELRVVWFACKLIEAQGKVAPDVKNLDLADKKTFDLISSGNTVGMFQISSKGLSDFVKKLKPDAFGDIVAATSLYRPGPKDAGMHDVYADRKNGIMPVKYLHKSLETILGTTYGVIVYQEQVMRIARDIGGYSLGGADLLRRAMGKKDIKEMETQRTIFGAGCEKNGINEDVSLELWSQIETFSRYGFNLCLSGDTVVTRAGASAGQKPEITIRELYEAQNSKTDWGKKIRYGKLNILQMDDDGMVRPGFMKQIIYSGNCEVLLITTTSGKSIKCTPNHRLLSDSGYVEAKDLVVGQNLIASQKPKPEKKNRQCIRAIGASYEGNGFLEGQNNPSYIDGRTGFLKNAKEAVAKRANGHCEFCDIKDDGSQHCLEFAHIISLVDLNGDYSKYHNDENIKHLCNSCHKKYDYQKGERKKRWSKGWPTHSEEIISIEPMPSEDVYDIEMSTEGHNFLANGIVSHNSHAVAYSMVTYQTAYLKAHFTAELLAAQMQVRSSDVEEVSEYIYDARRLGVKIIEANTDTSRYEFFVKNGEIIVGLCAIKGLNENIARKIETLRPRDIKELMKKVPEITKRDFHALVKAGAADEMIRRSIPSGKYVPAEQFRIDAINQFGEFATRCTDQISLFALMGMSDSPIIIGQSDMLDTNVMLNYEFDVLERFVTDHPAQIIRTRKKLSNSSKIEDLLPDRTYVLVMMMRGIKIFETKKGNEMAFLMFEDETGILDVTTFSDFYLENKSIIKERCVYIAWIKTQLYKDKMSATLTHLEYA